MAKLTFITGPARGGKSRRAVELASAWGDDVVFVATWRPSSDVEMRERVRRHVAERPAWRTLEGPADIAAALARLQPPPSGLVLDCLTLWLGDRLALDDDDIVRAWETHLTEWRQAPWPAVIVGNEVGWGPVPEQPIMRRFRDLAGTLAQRTAAAADETWLMVAGCGIRLR